ncbi:MAG: hypothetical protein V1494_04070 [Candidatus Diapherotrites archaeon]
MKQLISRIKIKAKRNPATLTATEIHNNFLALGLYRNPSVNRHLNRGVPPERIALNADLFWQAGIWPKSSYLHLPPKNVAANIVNLLERENELKKKNKGGKKRTNGKKGE